MFVLDPDQLLQGISIDGTVIDCVPVGSWCLPTHAEHQRDDLQRPADPNRSGCRTQGLSSQEE